MDRNKNGDRLRTTIHFGGHLQIPCQSDQLRHGLWKCGGLAPWVLLLFCAVTDRPVGTIYGTAGCRNGSLVPPSFRLLLDLPQTFPQLSNVCSMCVSVIDLNQSCPWTDLASHTTTYVVEKPLLLADLST